MVWNINKNSLEIEKYWDPNFSKRTYYKSEELPNLVLNKLDEAVMVVDK